MTMKHMKKNVSAEDEEIINNASFNSSTKTLTFSKKNFYTGEDGSPLVVQLNDFKINIEKINTISDLNTLANSNTDADKARKEKNLFLVPLDENDGQDADEYAEYVWFESKGKFEKIGTTRVDLEPLQTEINNKVNKENNKSLIENSKITKLDGIEAGANKTVTVDTVTNGESKPVTSNAVYGAIQSVRSEIAPYDDTQLKNLINNKQDKTDSNLNTSDTTIVGAINEINNAMQNFSSTNLYRITQDMVDASGAITSITIDTTDEFFFIVPNLNITSQTHAFYINRKSANLLTIDETIFKNTIYAVYKENGSYLIYQMSNDRSFVDTVTNDVLKPVTSNAVYDALGSYLTTEDAGETYLTIVNAGNTYATKQEVSQGLNSKVDTDGEKGLSKNDFTDSYKEILDTIETLDLTVEYMDDTPSEVISFVIQKNEE